MQTIDQQKLTGERALFKSKNLLIKNTTFAEGESPLKESEDITIHNSFFKWKYPLWYCQNIKLTNTTLQEMAHSGIWYSHHVNVNNSRKHNPSEEKSCVPPWIRWSSVYMGGIKSEKMV